MRSAGARNGVTSPAVVPDLPGTPVIRRILIGDDDKPVDPAGLTELYPDKAQEIQSKHLEQQRYRVVHPDSWDGEVSFTPVEDAAPTVTGPPTVTSPPTGKPGSDPHVPEPLLQTQNPTPTPTPQLASPGEFPAFRKYHEINKATPLIDPVGEPTVQTPTVKQEHKSVAFVANIITTPRGAGVQKIIDAYAARAVSEGLYGSFAMVIGVNSYRSVSGQSAASVLAATQFKAPFPVAVLSMLWNFNWNTGFTQASQAYQALSEDAKALVLQYEREQLNQSTIPYGQLREYVTAHRCTSEFVRALAGSHDVVYIHLGDDDAASLNTAAGKLIDAYHAHLSKASAGPGTAPRLLVGGYEFRARGHPLGGDLDPDEFGHQLAALASRTDTWFRQVLSDVDHDLVYPTEPNLAFLAAAKGQDLLTPMITPDNQQERRLATEARESGMEKGQYLSTGLIFGRSANEGGRLRERIRTTDTDTGKQSHNRNQGKGRGGKGNRGKSRGGNVAAPTAVTEYNPNLAIATASTRFTMSDTDRYRHELNERTYQSLRSDAWDSGGAPALHREIVREILTIKQSHIGGLAKELAGNKNARTIADDVFHTVTALLLNEEPPKPDPASKLIIEAISKRQEDLKRIADDIRKALKTRKDQPGPEAGKTTDPHPTTTTHT